MPLKRSSLPGSPATLSSPAHKYRESFNASASASSSSSTITHDTFSMNEFGTVQRQPDGSAGELKVVGALVSRLVNKLPCNSGIRLGTVEIDQGVQTTVDALLRLARIRLPLVVQALVGALETLSKYSSSTSLHDTPLDTIHSQLFLLHVLYLCLSSSWRLHASVAPPPPSEIPRCFSDPPPFDDNLARYLLATLLTYAHMVSSEAALVGGTISPMSNREAKSRETPPAPWARHEHPGSSSNCIGLKFLQRHSYSSSQSYDIDERKLLAPTSGSTSATIGQMAKYISRIIFYLSSSNWPLILSRIKARISFLTTTIDESPDLVELRLMEWSNPDRTRLSQVIQEISTTFLHVKRPAQVAVATVLRSCIWNWIRSYPGELEALVESNRNIEGGAESLFDVLNSASDISSSSSARKNKAFYPLMAMLLVVSPDTLKRAVLGEMAGRTSSSIAKRLNFLESLRKGLVTSKGFEACAVCYVDFVSAAMCLGPKLESAGVKSLVPDIQNDLKNALFYSSLAGDIDDDVLVSGLVGLYRTNAAISGTTVFSKLLNDISDSHKLLAVRACAEIVIEGDRLPWYPSVVGVRRDLAAPIRSLLKTLAASIVGTPSTARRPRSSVDVAQNVADLVSGILNLIAIDPAFAFTSYNAEDNLSSTLVIISSLLVGPCPEILRVQAGRAIVAVLDHLRAVAKVDAGTLAVAKSAAMATWTVLIDVARQELHDFQTMDFDGMSTTAESLRSISRSIAQLSDVIPDSLASAPNAPGGAMVAGIAALSSLLGLNTKSATITAPALVAMSKLNYLALRPVMAKQFPNMPEAAREAALGARLRIYEDLSSLPPALGRQHFQRQLRTVVRRVSIPSPVSIGCWVTVSALVKNLTKRIMAADSEATVPRRRGLAEIDGLDEDSARFWQDSVAVLAAYSAVCLFDGPQPPGVADLVGKGILPKVYDEIGDAAAAAESFIRDCVDLLICNSLTVRETVKEALGSELQPSLCRVLVTQMSKLMGHAVGPAGISVSEAFTTFIEQAIPILRSIVERMHPGENAMQIDMGELLHTMASYLQRTGRDDASLRLKARFCQLVELVLQKPNCVVLSNDGRFRNSILDWMTEWSTETVRDPDGYHLALEVSGKAQRELDQACLRAMVLITDGLSLRSSGEDETQTVVKSRLFYRYYLHFVKVLERSNASEVESFHPSRSISGRSVDTKIMHEDTSTLAIHALSNLLSANIDVGLKHCLSLGYHEDPALRTAFMQLLTNVLQQGARFGGLNATRMSAASKPYLDCLTSGNMALAVALVEACPPGEIDEVSLLLFRAFEAKGSLLQLAKVLVEREVTQTNHESELFRANSITTRILTVFAKTYGYNYVRATMQPLIHSLVEKPEQCSFELDPSKAAPGDDIERNADHLRLMCQALLDLICSSTPRVPVMFRALCHHIWEVVEDRFPDSRHSAVGSFIFLRFFCPAIVAPESIDLDVSPDTREIRRALLLITKVIQNLANNVVFGNKEPHMKILNNFLSENIRQVTKFLSDVAIRPRSAEVAQATRTYQDDAERAQDADGDDTILHRFAFKHITKIESSLDGMPTSYRHPTSTRPARIELDGRSALGRLRTITDETGPPADGGKLGAGVRSQIYDDFMRHNQGRNTESVAGVFYEGPASQNGRRIFYMIVSRLALVDHDLLAYHVFQTLDKVADFFDVVIDLTDFSPATELPLAWLRRSIHMCPPSLLPSVNTLALYNPNSYAKKRIRRLVSELFTICGPIGKNVVAASSPAELAEFIPFTSLALPEYTMELAYEADHVFTNLMSLSDHEMQVPVVVKLGHDCLQVASWRKQDLTPSIKAYIIDVIRLKDVEDVVLGSGLASDHLIIKHSQNDTITLVSRKRNEMAQIIRAARARLRDTPSAERALRPSDVPGTLLNIALLSLSSSDEVLRMGAYNLINELSQFFKYDLGSRVLKVSAGLSIPTNSLAYTAALSRHLATTAPQLTLEFLKEWTIGFGKADTVQKTGCLAYVGPWLGNLAAFAKPSREDSVETVKQVGEIIRSFIAITVAERRRLHLSIQEHVWQVLANTDHSLADVVVAELLHVALDAGLGSEKSECVGDILVSIASTAIRGKIIAKLRKTIAQTYLRPSATLSENTAWLDICTLARLTLILSFSPTASLDAQLFLPELSHIITLLLGSGPLLMRQTVYGILVNVLQSLATSPASGEMDTQALAGLLSRVQTAEVMGWFGLAQNPGSLELVGTSREDGDLLANVQGVASFLGETLEAGATSIDCANAWRARWMGLVVATCFQHNPSTQPQAFTVLGQLVSEEVDDDLVYQILVAMSTTLGHYSESDANLVISMLRCLSRIISGLLPDSRYAGSLFWLAVGVCQLGYIPVFSAALELMKASLRSMAHSGAFAPGLAEGMMDNRRNASDAARKLDTVCGVNFEASPHFSIVAIIFKGVRHPSTRRHAVETLTELLKLSASKPSTSYHPNTSAIANSNSNSNGEDTPMIPSQSLAYFVALLPVMAGSSAELKELFASAGLSVAEESLRDVAALSVFDLLNIPDNSTALLLVTLVVTILNTASSDAEKLVLYRFLAEASVEVPDVVSMAYDTLVPRMTAVLATTSNTSILSSVTAILERALADTNYSFPSAGILSSESMSSLHQKSYSASISSVPSVTGLGIGGGMGGSNGGGGGGRAETVLEDMGMKGLAELSFPHARMERVGPMAKWVAALIEGFTI